MTHSANDNLIVEVYQKSGGLEEKVKSGFAIAIQSSRLKGLKLLFDAHLINGRVLKKDSVIYFEEKFLYTDATMKSKNFLGETEVMVLPYSRAILIEEKSE